MRIIKKYSIIMSKALFVLVSMAVFLCTSPELSGAGDLNIAEFVLSEGKIGSGFYYISPLLCDMLRQLNHIWHINWWSIYSVVMTFSGLFVMLCFIGKRYKAADWTARVLLSVLFVFFFWELILKCEINFAHTATCATVAGVLLLGDAFAKDGMGKSEILRAAIGFLFLLLSVLTRGAMLILVLPFFVMTVIYVVVFPIPTENCFSESVKSLWKNKRLIIPCLLIVVAVLTGNMVEKVYERSNPDIKVWKDTNAAGSAICDYPDQYPVYEDDPEVYDQIGIKESWLNMIYDFCYSDKNTYTPETLGIMKAYRTPSVLHISDFMEMLKEHLLLWGILVAILVVLGILYGWKAMFIPLSGATAGFIICSLYCIYRGRIAWRVTNSYVLFGLLSILIMVSMTERPEPIVERQTFTETRINWIIATGLVLLIGFAAVKDEKGHLSLPVAKVINETQAEVLDDIDANDDTLYFYFDLIRFGGAYNLWKGHDPDYLDNYIPLTTCFVLGCREDLESRGVYDLYRDIVTKPKMYVEYSSNTLNSFYRYLCGFYDPCMTATIAEDHLGALYFRFSSRILPNGNKKIETLSSFTPSDFYGCPDHIKDVYLVECRMAEKDIGSFNDYWVNVEDSETGLTYSYGMNTEDNKVLGTILRMSGTWNKDNCKICLVGEDESGNKLILDDLTEVFAETEGQSESEDV